MSNTSSARARQNITCRMGNSKSNGASLRNRPKDSVFGRPLQPKSGASSTVNDSSSESKTTSLTVSQQRRIPKNDYSKVSGGTTRTGGQRTDRKYTWRESQTSDHTVVNS